MSYRAPSHFFLREITSSDGPAINALASRCSDGGLVSVRSAFRENACKSLEALRPDMAGVAAEPPGHDGLIGMCWVSFGRCRIQEEMVSYALLNTLMVHPDWRRQALAERLLTWTIDYVTRRFGEKVLMMGAVRAGNAASHRTAGKRATQVLPADGLLRPPLSTAIGRYRL